MESIYLNKNGILWRKSLHIFAQDPKCDNCVYGSGDYFWKCSECKKNFIVCWECHHYRKRFTADENNQLWYTWSCTNCALSNQTLQSEKVANVGNIDYFISHLNINSSKV